MVEGEGRKLGPCRRRFPSLIALPVARPLHHPLFGGRFPSPVPLRFTGEAT